MSRHSKHYEALGLITEPSQATVPGAMSSATNLVARRPKVLENRRALEAFTNLTGAVYGMMHKLGATGDPTLVIVGATVLTQTNNDSPVSSGVAVFPPDQARFISIVEDGRQTYLPGMDGSLYEGLYRMDDLGAPLKAGGAPGLCFDRTGPAAVLTGTGGQLADQFQRAYRYKLAIDDAHKRRVVGEPSSRTIVSNASFVSGWVTGVAKDVVLRAILPDEATASHLIQIFRSKSVPVGTQPDDDLQLVYQDYLTSKNISDGYVEITDVYPNTIPMGAYISTSPNFGTVVGNVDGEEAYPPISWRACVYKNRLFLFKLKERAAFQLTILAVGGTNGIQNNDTITLGGRTYTGVTGVPAANQYKIVSAGSTTQNLTETALNLVECINKDSSGTLNARYISGPDDITAKLLLEGKPFTATATQFTVYVGSASKRTCFEPVLSPPPATALVATLTRATITVTATVANNFRAGEQVVVVGGVGFNSGTFTLLTATSSAVTFLDGASAPAGSISGTLTITGIPTAVYQADAVENGSGFAYSKLGEHDAFPRRNRGTVPVCNNVLAVVQLEDTIIIGTDRGVFRMVGETPDTFEPVPIDPDQFVIAPNTWKKLGRSAIGMTNKGLMRFAEDGFQVLSAAIRPTLDAAIITSTPAGAYGVAQSIFYQGAFGVARNADELYELWYPPLIPDDGTPVYCDRAFVYSLREDKWTDYQLSEGVGATQGVDAAERQRGIYTTVVYGAPTYHLQRERELSSDTVFAAGAEQAPDGSSVTIPIVAEFQPFQGNRRANLKIWQQAEVVFEKKAPTALIAEYQGDLEIPFTDSISIVSPEYQPAVPVWINSDAQGATLYLSLSAVVDASAQPRLVRLVGLTLFWEEFGPEVQR